MNDITLTKDNAPRFNKRLQKALNQYLKNHNIEHQITLSESADLFAQSCGQTNTHQLQQVLAKQASLITNRPVNAEKAWIMDIESQIKTYFATHPVTHLTEFSWTRDSYARDFCLQFLARNRGVTDEEFQKGVGEAGCDLELPTQVMISKDQSPLQLLASELVHYDLTVDDEIFLTKLVTQFPTDIKFNATLTVELQKHTGCHEKNQWYCIHQQSPQAVLENQSSFVYALLPENFEDTDVVIRRGDFRWDMKLDEQSVFDDFNAAAEHRKGNEVIVGVHKQPYKTPVSLGAFVMTPQQNGWMVRHVGWRDVPIVIEDKQSIQETEWFIHMIEHQFFRPMAESYAINDSRFEQVRKINEKAKIWHAAHSAHHPAFILSRHFKGYRNSY